MSGARPYARVYHEIVDDPKFRRVFHDDAALATWLRMLLVADAMYPASAPMPESTESVELLLKVKLIKRLPGNRYVVTGLHAERERRASSARIGAAKRWQSERNANALQTQSDGNARRDETSKDETSNGANAPKNGAFMGFRPRPTASLADVRRQEAEAWEKCAHCGVIGQKHTASGDHPFRAAAGVGR